MILFVRHGQTAINREGRLQGRLDAPLSEQGMAQAAAVAEHLRDQKVTRVVSSPLIRACDTARAIASVHALDVELDARLIELDYGDWDGASLRDVTPEQWATWRADPAFVPPGSSESLIDVTMRVASFCADSAADEIVVAVSHVSPIKAAVCAALGVDERATWRMQLGVASLCRIGQRPDGTLFLLSFNELA